MSVEDHVTSVYQLPKFRLTAAPRHVYSSQIPTEDSGNKSSGSQFFQAQQPQGTGSGKNAFHMLQTQECSSKFSSALLSSQTSPHGRVAVPSSTAVTVKVKSGDPHIWPACLQTVEDRKMKSSLVSACTTPPCGSSSGCMDGPLMIRVLHHTNSRHQRSGKLTLQTNSSMIPSTTRNVVEQPKKSNGKPSTTSSRAVSRPRWKANLDDTQKNRELPVGTFHTEHGSCNDATIKKQCYINDSHNNINNNNFLRQSDFGTLQLIDRASCRPTSQRKVEAGSVASPSNSDTSKRRISIALLMQNGSVKSSQFTLTTRKSDVNSQVAPGSSDNTDYGISSRSVTPELQTLQPEKTAVMVKQHADDVDSYTERLVSNSSIRVEKRLLSNMPMTICTLPVPRPAFVCKSLLPETATSSKPSFSCCNTAARLYHETTRSQRQDNLPLTESGHSTERWRSAMISRLPYVGADLWELTTQRLQRAVIDKVSHGPQNEQVSDVTVSKPGYEVSTSNNPSTASCSLQSAEQSHNDVGRLVKKCLSAKTIRPKSELMIRASQSTSHLQQNCVEEDEDESAVDCNVEL